MNCSVHDYTGKGLGDILIASVYIERGIWSVRTRRNKNTEYARACMSAYAERLEWKTRSAIGMKTCCDQNCDQNARNRTCTSMNWLHWKHVWVETYALVSYENGWPLWWVHGCINTQRGDSVFFQIRIQSNTLWANWRVQTLLLLVISNPGSLPSAFTAADSDDRLI
jgi:hypothetical protein